MAHMTDEEAKRLDEKWFGNGLPRQHNVIFFLFPHSPSIIVTNNRK